MQEFQPYERPYLLNYSLWWFSVLLVLGLLGLVIVLTFTI